MDIDFRWRSRRACAEQLLSHRLPPLLPLLSRRRTAVATAATAATVFLSSIPVPDTSRFILVVFHPVDATSKKILDCIVLDSAASMFLLPVGLQLCCCESAGRGRRCRSCRALRGTLTKTKGAHAHRTSMFAAHATYCEVAGSSHLACRFLRRRGIDLGAAEVTSMVGRLGLRYDITNSTLVYRHAAFRQACFLSIFELRLDAMVGSSAAIPPVE